MLDDMGRIAGAVLFNTHRVISGLGFSILLITGINGYGITGPGLGKVYIIRGVF